MIAQWPPKPRYESAKRLREASARLQEMRDTVTKAVTDIDALLAGLDTYSRTAKQARDIRDDLAAVIDESGRQ